MKRPQIIGLSVALSAGLVAFVLVRGMVNQPPVEKRVEIQAKSSEVLVAASDIGLGQVVGGRHAPLAGVARGCSLDRRTFRA